MPFRQSVTSPVLFNMMRKMHLSRSLKLSVCVLLCLAAMASIITMGPYVRQGHGAMQRSYLLNTVHNLENRIDVLHNLFGSHMKNTQVNVDSLSSSNSSIINQKQLINSHGGYARCTNDATAAGKVSRKDMYAYFTDAFPLDKEPVASWLAPSRQTGFCNGQLTLFDNRFGILHDVIIHPNKRPGAFSQAKGGEQVKDVLNQDLNEEQYTFEKGFFELLCRTGEMLNIASQFTMMRALEVSSRRAADILKGEIQIEDKYAIVVARVDYANLHNWARNIYNTFLLMAYFNIQPENITVVFLDGHPFTNLDLSWEIIFGPPVRIGRVEKPVFYKNLIWGFIESDGPVSDYERTSVPYLEEYRVFVLNQHNLDNVAILNCKRLKITIILRRNAVYHPRNIAGNVGRKIFNEAEVLGAIMSSFPDACVQGVLMESLPMKNQLEIISQTDILIGMHGAGMSHTLFLPQHAGILELFPKGFKTGRPWYRCYQSIAQWRSMKYETWENFDPAIEMPHDFTILPSYIIVDKVKSLYKNIC